MRALTFGSGFGLGLLLTSLCASPVAAQEEPRFDAPEREVFLTPEEFDQDNRPPQAEEALEVEPDGVPHVFETDARVVAVSMSQGWTDRLAQFLERVELIDENGDWIGGEDHLVYLGNLFGYGPQNIEGLELLSRIARQAEEADGRVHFLFGSTDYLNMRGVLSSMPPSTYEHLATAESQARLDERLERWLEELWEFNSEFPEDERLNLRRNFERFYKEAHKPGAMEFLDLFAPGTETGDWIRQSNTVVRINDVLFVSGGIHPGYAGIPLAKINTWHRQELNKDSVFVPVMADINTGPGIWRGLSYPGETSVTLQDINRILADYEARAMVVGHSPSRFGESLLRGRVMHVDSNFMAPQDQAAYGGLILQDGKFTIINSGRERTIPAPPVPERAAAAGEGDGQAAADRE